MPWLNKGMIVGAPSLNVYQLVRNELIQSGFEIAEQDDTLLRLCAYRERASNKCHCLHVLWARRTGRATYVSYGIEPRFFFFWSCRHGDHFSKMGDFKSMIISVLDPELIYPKYF